jgi:hypothetical protein
MKRGKKRLGKAASAGAGSAGTNPRLQAQTRRQLRTHYAAKYRARQS